MTATPGYTLSRLMREAGALPGVERLRLSSIEVNHLTTTSSPRCARPPTASLHLHVPLQSGDDGVLRAMRRRYSAAQYVAKLAPLEDFNLTADVIVGFPGEDEDGLRPHARRRSATRGSHVSMRSRTRRGPGTPTAASRHGVRAEKKERSARLRAFSDELSRRRWASRIGSTDRVLVDRPGRGYGDDYTPWLVDGEVGQLLHARAIGVSEEGILAVAA